MDNASSCPWDHHRAIGSRVKNEGHLQFCIKNEEGIGDIYKGCGIYIGDAG